MQLIKLGSSTGVATQLSSGEFLNGWTKALWVERYNKAGEFRIEAPVSSGLREQLPVGTFISHVATSELMMVENHEIEQPDDEESNIVITGRSFVAFLENRTIGSGAAAVGPTIPKIVLPSAATWVQVVNLINTYFVTPSDANNDLVGVGVTHTCSGSSTSTNREMKMGTVYDRILELLPIDDIGLKTVRPTPSDPLTYFVVYRGEDKTATVRFSWQGGDLSNIQYLHSIKSLKTSAHVYGKWVQIVVNLVGYSGYTRRRMLIEANDIDSQLNAMPTGLELADIQGAMTVRGMEALAAQKTKSITQVDISPTAKVRYREDYNLGDLVLVHGDFGISEVLRVTEYAETSDEEGTTGHPTLTIPGEE